MRPEAVRPPRVGLDALLVQVTDPLCYGTVLDVQYSTPGTCVAVIRDGSGNVGSVGNVSNVGNVGNVGIMCVVVIGGFVGVGA